MFHSGEPDRGIYITHRIIEESNENGETLFVTKGDNNHSADSGFVNASQLKGRVIAIVPKIGNITLFLRGLLNK
jgi:signal peptidase